MTVLNALTALALVCGAEGKARSSAAFSNEQERVVAYHAKGYTWPPDDTLKPNTPEYRHLIAKRAQHLAEISSSQQRWDGWLNLAKQLLVPNFTETGFRIVQAPKELHKKLYDRLHQHLQGDWRKNVPPEGSRPLEILGPNQPLFYQNTALNNEIMRELLPMHEEWAGVELAESMTYGVRIYRNLSQLLMHIDRTDTHIISSIFHIDHHYDDPSEAWPIEIEDYKGQTHKFDLKPGQILNYESAKCFHGRPQTFKGSYYASIFIHYRPKNDWWINNVEAQIRIPPEWTTGAQVDTVSDRIVRGTGHKGDWFSYLGHHKDLEDRGL